MNCGHDSAACENDSFGPIPDKDWRFLEEAAGIEFHRESMRLISKAVESFITARTRDRSGDLVSVAKSSVRRELDKIDTCVRALQKSCEQVEAAGLSIETGRRRLAAEGGTHWAARCGNYEERRGGFDLKMYDYLKHFLWFVEDQEKDFRNLQKQCLKAKSALDQAIKHTNKLRALLTLSDGAAPKLNAGPLGTAIVIKGAGVDKVNDAAIALFWFHLQTALRKKRVGHYDFPAVLRLTNDAVSSSKEETYGGKRSNQRDFILEALIIQCAMAFERTGGHVSLYYSGEKERNKKTTGFLPFLFELNGLMKEFGCAPADGDAAIAQAAQKLFKRAKLEPAINFTIGTGD